MDVRLFCIIWKSSKYETKRRLALLKSYDLLKLLQELGIPQDHETIQCLLDTSDLVRDFAYRALFEAETARVTQAVDLFLESDVRRRVQ